MTKAGVRRQFKSEILRPIKAPFCDGQHSLEMTFDGKHYGRTNAPIFVG